jgi:serine/threonine protein kinase/tetratricopeptide (TPR) repeat protein
MASTVSAKVNRIPTLPAPGDKIFHFRLGRELGRGAFARVFLAEQADLANRHVVLKCSATEGSEPQTLAQLQHTNIVPIYSVHEDRESGLRAVCMPWFGGATLSQVLEAVWRKTQRPLRGADLAEALKGLSSRPEEGTGPSRKEDGRRSSGMIPVEKGGSPTPLDLLKSLDYVRAAAWIVARLADGLQHAHQRGVLHHDIKPSNILLGADGQPMLLDFNLAGIVQEGQSPSVLGGTVAYLAPEHLRALGSRDPLLKAQVDRRSDVYSLGMVLFETLTGQSPFAQKSCYSALAVRLELMAVERNRAQPSVRQKRSDIPWTLESIVRKCLAPDPAQRYQQAAHLATDLRRFLDDLPLCTAPELSWTERVRKWMRRHPQLTSSASVALIAAALLGGTSCLLIGVRNHLAETQKQLELAQALERKRGFEEWTQRALCLVNTTADLGDHQRRGKEACLKALSFYRVLDQDDWQDQAAWRQLSAEDRPRLGEDVRELLLLLAANRARAATEDPAALGEALGFLDKAESITGLPPSRALFEDRALYLEKQGDVAAARVARALAGSTTPSGVRDRYLLAVSYARNGRYGEAIAELDQALKQNPRHYWSSFQRGLCNQELGKYSLAVGDFGVCIGLWQEFALGYFNRGYNLDLSGAKAEAIRDYTTALEADPTFAPAFLNRGLAHLELKHHREALADFDKVTELGRDNAFVHAGRGVALEGLGMPTEADAAFAAAFARSANLADPVAVRIRWVYGFAVFKRLPDKALAAFDEVLVGQPEHPQALYGRAMLLTLKGQDSEALALFDRAIAASPGFVEARRSRAVLQARRGNLDAARQEINLCLVREPESGSVLYAAACVASWVSFRSTDPATSQQAQAQALDLLGRAFARGYGRDQAAADPDLIGMRQHPGFRRLVGERQ